MLLEEEMEKAIPISPDIWDEDTQKDLGILDDYSFSLPAEESPRIYQAIKSTPSIYIPETPTTSATSQVC